MSWKPRAQGKTPNVQQTRDAARKASDARMADMSRRPAPEPPWSRDPSLLPKKPPGGRA